MALWREWFRQRRGRGFALREPSGQTWSIDLNGLSSALNFFASCKSWETEMMLRLWKDSPLPIQLEVVHALKEEKKRPNGLVA